jgi:hypothetical protein
VTVVISSPIQKKYAKSARFGTVKKKRVHIYAAISESGFKQGIKFDSKPKHKRRNRKRNVIWFNPPYNASVLTNIGKEFLSLLSKHFPKDHKFYKIFNK